MIYYRGGYKYQLAKTYRVRVAIRPPAAIRTPFLALSIDGWLTIKKGYAWDGPSGPTIDTKNFMRGSLVHDALFQLMRSRRLSQEFFGAANDELRFICLADGMSAFRAWYVHRSVQRFGRDAAFGPEKPTLTAP